MQWPDFKFPPINLHTVWPSKEMQSLHLELLQQDHGTPSTDDDED